MFRLTNIVRCRPPHDILSNTSYEFEVIQHCRPYLLDTLREKDWRCILALGGTAFRELTGYEGAKQGISYCRGYVLPCVIAGFEHVPVIGTFHPSFLRQGKPAYFGVLAHDIKRAVTIATEKDRDFRPLNTSYLTRPSLDAAWSYYRLAKDMPNKWLTYDIETPSSAEMDEDERDEEKSFDLTQIQFSIAQLDGIALPPTPEYMEVARALLQLPNPKAGHNVWLFDDPRLVHNGLPIRGQSHDTMAMWHHMQPDLPANLQFVASFYGMDRPWKHLAGVDLAEYGCADVDACHRILAALPEQMRRRGVWDGYERYVYHLRPILERMERRGIPVNDERRIAFGSELDAAAAVTDAEMQLLVPDEIKNVHPKQGYKREPKVLDGLVQRTFGIDTVNGVDVVRYCRIEPFKPSSQQLIRYMKHRGHPVPINLKKGRETSEAKELERLARKTHDPLYRKVIWYREVRLMKSTFVDGWAPGPDGRVHSTFTYGPATWQLGSRDPNVQNAPEHEKEGRDTGLADKFQRIMEAPDGYRFVSFDHKSFHALTLAHLANDNDYMRVVRLDIHSFLAAQFLKLASPDKLLAMPDDDLREFLSTVKRNHRAVRDSKAKRTILGWGFGMGYRTLYNTYMESFSGEKEAKQMIQLLEASFPKTVRFRKQIVSKAHYDTFLLSPFGGIRWFWDVMHFDPRTGQPRNGDQAEQAIAYLPATCAFGMMRDEALRMSEQGLDERYGLVNTIHDSYRFCCKNNLVEECIHTVKSLMEAPSPTMNGLWCAVSVTVGKNLGAKSASNPNGREEINVKSGPVPGLSTGSGETAAGEEGEEGAQRGADAGNQPADVERGLPLLS
jgi:hypothetical protein